MMTTKQYVCNKSKRMTFPQFVPRPPPPPIWKPDENRVLEPRPVPPRRELPNVLAVIAQYMPHRPPLKPFVDALRLDGHTEEYIKKVRESYARARRESDKDQAKIDKIFGKYNTKTPRKTPKKVLKILKKK